MNENQKIGDFFGELISKGWNRKDATEATANAVGLPLSEIERIVWNRG